jgi:hypothetical protein
MKSFLKKTWSKLSPAYRRVGLVESKVNNLNRQVDQLVFQLKSEHDQLWMKKCWLSCDASGVTEVKRSTELVVSLTTIPQRINTVHLTIESIFQQSTKPDAVILWLDEDNFDEESIPWMLRKMETRGLEIKFCEDIKSYKKLVFTHEERPEAAIVTADDDLIYPSTWLEKLYKRHLDEPSCVICHRGHWVRLADNGELLPYQEWGKETQQERPSYNIFPTGSGGVLYPPGSLNEQVSDIKLFRELSPSADDIWFKAMTMLNSRKVCCVMGGMMSDQSAVLISESQQIALCHQNVAGGENQKQAEAVFTHFDLVKMFE